MAGQTFTLARFVFWILIVILPAIPVALAELYLRSIGLGHPILYYANSSYRYAPLPNQKQVRQRGAAITIDSKGLRGMKDWNSSADGKILFVGDSVTWGGTYIDDKDTFANRVCVQLEKSLKRTFVCGNAGVNAYGTDNMAERIRYKDFADESAIVVTLITADTVRGMSDLWRLPSFTAQPPGPFKALWEAGTFVVWKLLQVLRPVSHDPAHDLQVADRSLSNLVAVLQDINRANRKVLIVLSPEKRELNGKESDLTKRVRSVLDGSGLDFLDLHQPISAVPNDSFFYDTAHLEVPGHYFVANRIADRLEAFFAKRL